MKLRHKLALTLATLLAGTNAAMAASPVGLWDVQFFNEPVTAFGTDQGICFEADGTWFSTTFSGWHGTWFQKGDRVRWVGTTGAFLTSAFGAFDSTIVFGGEYSTMVAATAGTGNVGVWVAGNPRETCNARLATRHAARAGDPTK
jgi:hypothetical protein